ncbi:U2 snRNP auxilliary factor, partial [Striga asiatica]
SHFHLLKILKALIRSYEHLALTDRDSERERERDDDDQRDDAIAGGRGGSNEARTAALLCRSRSCLRYRNQHVESVSKKVDDSKAPAAAAAKRTCCGKPIKFGTKNNRIGAKKDHLFFWDTFKRVEEEVLPVEFTL